MSSDMENLKHLHMLTNFYTNFESKELCYKFLSGIYSKAGANNFYYMYLKSAMTKLLHGIFIRTGGLLYFLHEAKTHRCYPDSAIKYECNRYTTTKSGLQSLPHIIIMGPNCPLATFFMN